MKYILSSLIVALLTIASPSQVFAEINIVTSVAPIANLASMLLGSDANANANANANVEVIASSGGCPHHYHAKPSDLKKINEADLVIYIDEDFDSFIASLIKSYQGNIFKISDIKNLKLLSGYNNTNWHIWLDLENAAIILKELADKLILLFPQRKHNITQNLEKAISKILILQKIKNEKLTSVIKPALLTASLDYFFLGTEIDFIKSDYNNQNSLKFYRNLESSLNKQSRKCLIIDNEQNINSFKKLGIDIIQIDPENWPVDAKSDFIVNYTEIINQISSCAK